METGGCQLKTVPRRTAQGFRQPCRTARQALEKESNAAPPQNAVSWSDGMTRPLPQTASKLTPHPKATVRISRTHLARPCACGSCCCRRVPGLQVKLRPLRLVSRRCSFGIPHDCSRAAHVCASVRMSLPCLHLPTLSLLQSSCVPAALGLSPAPPCSCCRPITASASCNPRAAGRGLLLTEQRSSQAAGGWCAVATSSLPPALPPGGGWYHAAPSCGWRPPPAPRALRPSSRCFMGPLFSSAQLSRADLLVHLGRLSVPLPRFPCREPHPRSHEESLRR